jgi:D-sedoheptulose 7-phosphate isomerase
MTNESMEKYLKSWDAIDMRKYLLRWGGILRDAMLEAKIKGGVIYLCGNGGSAANAMHLANDFTYGYCDANRRFNVEALPANASVLTCLANDIGYDKIFSHQLENKLKPQDLVIVLSGSGNSPNIIKAIEVAKAKGAKTLGMLGFNGGKAKTMVDILLHAEVDDMQVAEDLQVMIGHAAMRMMEEQQAVEQTPLRAAI